MRRELMSFEFDKTMSNVTSVRRNRAHSTLGEKAEEPALMTDVAIAQHIQGAKQSKDGGTRASTSSSAPPATSSGPNITTTYQQPRRERNEH